MSHFYAKLAQAIAWCETVNDEYRERANDQLDKIIAQLPYGSGFDQGCKINEKSTPQRIVIDTAFHHMDEHGYYDGWTEHQVIVTPCLQYGFDLRITGKDRNGIKEYMYDIFSRIQLKEEDDA